MDANTIINTVRHGETAYNREKRYAGTIDVPLNENGISSTLDGSKKLRGIKFDIVITSTLKRSIQTARLLVGDDISLVKNHLCNERNYGKMQGLTEEEVELIKPKILYVNVGSVDHSVNPPEGEPFELLRERAVKFKSFIFENYEGSNILVVSHGIFLQQFHGLIQGKSCIESLRIVVPNLEMMSFHFKGPLLIREKSANLTDKEQSSW